MGTNEECYANAIQNITVIMIVRMLTGNGIARTYVSESLTIYAYNTEAI